MPRYALYAFSVFLCLFAVTAWGQGSFRIGDIRVQGVQRLEPGTVLTYLPLRVGDELTEQRAQQAIHALYQTGLFENVALSREGNTLVVQVQERPTIARFSIQGNELLGGDDLKKMLKDRGLERGQLFRKAMLDQSVQEIRTQYYANGFYSVRIDPQITDLGNNRVAIDIDIQEGPVATIQDINIVGNDVFSDELLKEEVFSLQESKPFYTHMLTFWRSYDKYSRQRLLGDLEALNSFYQNRGYIRFNVSSVQVSLSPNKHDIYITVSVDEGQQYSISGYKVAGDVIVPQTSIERFITIKQGEIFKRAAVTASAERMSAGLADLGYAFAEVDPLTKINDEDNTVALTFYIKPGKRTYVRRITFSGNEQTNDSTLRREMRQFEGAPFSRRAVERSRTRLARLPYIQTVKVDTEPVPGTQDMVDVNYEVEERPAGKLQFGLGFSDTEGFLINGGITHQNFRGTGDTVSVNAQTTDYVTSFSASWTDPYFTEDGISRTLAGHYRDIDRLYESTSGFDLTSMGVGLTFGIPISEYSGVRLGAALEYNEIHPNEGSAKRITDFVKENGAGATTLEIRTGWQRDTRNKSFFATRGSYTAVNFDFKVPGSDLEYYDISLQHTRYFRIGDWLPLLSDGFVLSMDAEIGYTDDYGAGTDVPPYALLYAGGPRSVRGFSGGGLGSHNCFDGDGDRFACGGKLSTTLQTELTIPTPFDSDGKTTRLALFYDIGNVYQDIDDFDADLLRSSAGVAFYWFTPFFGLLRISYAPYVDAQQHDDVDRFQFSFGVGF